MTSYPTTTLEQADFFWGEIAPSEHIVEFYEESEAFLDSLEGFVVGGLQNTDSVILILTPSHLKVLEERLVRHGLDLPLLRLEDRYVTLDAATVLSMFMFRGWPEEKAFQQTITPLLERAKSNGRRVRVFGEMVALLWAEGYHGATVHLEHLWHNLCQVEGLSLFCAYPKSGFTENSLYSIQAICDSHSKVYYND